ncbi:MAG: hypothetical protein AAGC60_29430 [Acidobacteriota bacterium]
MRIAVSRRHARPAGALRRPMRRLSAGGRLTLGRLASLLAITTLIVGSAPLESALASSWFHADDGHAACASWTSGLDRGHERHDESRFEASHRAHHQPHGMLSIVAGPAAIDLACASTATFVPPVARALDEPTSASSIAAECQRGRAPPGC